MREKIEYRFALFPTKMTNGERVWLDWYLAILDECDLWGTSYIKERRKRD